MNQLFTLEQLAQQINGVGYGNAQYAISGLSSLTRAQSSDLTYFDNPFLIDHLKNTQAGIILIQEEYLSCCPCNAIVVRDPLLAMKKIATLFPTPAPVLLIDPSAKIHPSVELGNKVIIGPFAVIERGVVLADEVVIGSHTCIHSDVIIGKQTHIDSQVTIHSNSLIAEDVLINSGTVIGARPYNYLKERGAWQAGFNLGGVTIESKVHIGANAVIDRGAVGDTYLAQGVCIDNLVHIAHDAYIGTQTAIAGCAVIGAHVIIGSDCIIGGASCLAASISLSNDVVITGMSTVNKSITKPGIYSSGTLVHEHNRWRKNAARFRRLDDYMNKLALLDRKINSEN